MMKKPLILSIVGVLVVGLGVFVFLQKGSEVGDGNGKQKAVQTKSSEVLDRKVASEVEEADVAATKSEREIEASESAPDRRSERREAARNMMTQFGNAMSKRNEAKAAKLIEKLVEELGLSPAQKAALEEHFAKQVAMAGGLMSGEINEDDPMASVKAMQQLDGKGLDELMAELLSPEQKEQWDENEVKKQHRLADSGALKELADLNSVIEVREDQRDAVYEHFYQKRLAAEEDNSERGAVSAVVGSITEGLGINVDTSSVFNTDFSALAAETNTDGGGVDYAELMRRQREQQIESQVSELAPILDENQLDNYREHLESKGSLLDGLIPTTDAGVGADVQSFVIPMTDS